MPFIKDHQTGQLLENINVLFEPFVPLYSSVLILINLNENATMLYAISLVAETLHFAYFTFLRSPFSVANWIKSRHNSDKCVL